MRTIRNMFLRCPQFVILPINAHQSRALSASQSLQKGTQGSAADTHWLTLKHTKAHWRTVRLSVALSASISANIATIMSKLKEDRGEKNSQITFSSQNTQLTAPFARLQLNIERKGKNEPEGISIFHDHLASCRRQGTKASWRREEASVPSHWPANEALSPS